MRKTAIVIYCLTAGIAWAQDDAATSERVADEAEEQSAVIETRISVIEVIDVTAEKPPALSADDPDDDIDAILDEAELLDGEDEGVEQPDD